MSGSVLWSDEEDLHFCRESCKRRGAPCDLCLLQRKRMRDQRMLKGGKPTLTHQPFTKLLSEGGWGTLSTQEIADVIKGEIK